MAYGYSSGNVLFDPPVAFDYAELAIQGPTIGYAHAVDYWGLSGKFDAAAGWACADGHAVLDGAPCRGMCVASPIQRRTSR